MPPAFNLSQDQTLQFDLCKISNSLDSGYPHPLTGQRQPTAESSPSTALASCEHQCLETPRPAKKPAQDPNASAPTPIDCKLLKSAREVAFARHRPLLAFDERGQPPAERRD